MSTYILTVTHDYEQGVLGLYPEGATLDQTDYNPVTSGFLMAHDIIEHANIKGIGSIGDELKAMGGVWFTRGLNGELTNYYTPQENIASDVTRMARDYVLGEDFNEPIPNVRTCEALTDLIEIVAIAKENLKHELDPEDRNPEREKEYFDKAIKFLIKGYQVSNRRFHRYGGSYGSLQIFNAIKNAVDHVLKFIDFEGQQFKLTVDFKNRRAYCDEYYDYDDY